MNPLLWMLLLACAFPAAAARLNDPAPAFDLRDARGQAIRLADYRDRVLLVNFWASWCPPCKQEFPALDRLAAELKEEPVGVLAVAMDKTASNVERFLAEHAAGPLHLRVALDPRGKAASAFGARAMPSSFIVDRRGIIRFVHFGYDGRDPEKWRQEIGALLREEGTLP